MGVHVGNHVAEPAHHPGPFGHVVPDRLVLGGLVADVHPAGRRAVADQGAGIDPQVKHATVVADPAGGEGDLAAAADPLKYRVVLGSQLFGDDRRRLADDLVGGPPEETLGGGIPQQHGAVGAEGHDRVGRGLDDRARCRVHPAPAASYRKSQPHDLMIAPRRSPWSAKTRCRLPLM